MSKAKTVYSLCGMCGARCPVEVTVRQGRPAWICGNRHTPQGTALCPRGAAGVSLLDDDKRVLMPMIRTGARGAGQWREVEWDEALDYVAENLRDGMHRHGPRSLLWSERPGPHSALTRALVRAAGSPNFCTHSATCRHNVDEAAFSLTGKDSNQWTYDYSRCKHLVLQGRNLFEALSTGEARTAMNALCRSEAQGGPCRLTVMDVRATVTGAKAQRFWRVRPGTDYALNLAVIHALLRDGLCCAPALETLDRGQESLDELRDFVREYTPQWAATECELGDTGAADIEALVCELAEAAPSVIWHPGWMASRYTQSLMLSRSAWIINALLGSLGSPGGIVPTPPAKDAQGRGLHLLEGLYPSVKEPRADGVGWKYPHFSKGATILPEALAAARSGEPYPLSAYIAYRHDPLTSLPDAAILKEQLAHIPLLVSITPTWSDTAWYSDVVLPLCVYLENDFPLQAKPGPIPRIFRPARAAEPAGDSRPDWYVLSGLAQRLGLDKLVFTSAAQMWEKQLQGSGLNLRDFDDTGFVPLADSPRSMPLLPLPTPSGKVELISRRWSEAEAASLHAYERPASPPKGAFRLVVGRVAQHTHAATQNLSLLAVQFGENVAWIHPDRAHQLDIHDGELVMLEGTRPHFIRAKVTPEIHPEALFMVHGFGHTLPMEQRACGKGAADQALMPGGLDIVDKAGHVPALQEHFITVRKIHRESA